MITKYNSWRLSMLLESILYAEYDLKQLLLQVDHPYADNLLQIINSQQDIKTNYNGLKVDTNANNKIGFLPDSQFQRFSEVDKWKRPRSEADLGRMVKQILTAAGHEVDNSELEKFVTAYKGMWNFKYSKEYDISIVEGEEIRKWYDEKNYVKTIDSYNSSLAKSCMRYSSCQPYFSIYVDNPEYCKMVILKIQNKIKARALVWTLSNGDLYLDRIYFTHEGEQELIKNWITEKYKNKKIKFFQVALPSIEISLKSADYQLYPYVDSAYYLYMNHIEGVTKPPFILTTSPGTLDLDAYGFDKKDKPIILKLRSTEGGYDSQVYGWSKKYRKWTKKANSILYLNDWIPNEYVVTSKYLKIQLPNDEATYSLAFDDWIPNDRIENSIDFGAIDKNWISILLTAKGEIYPHVIKKRVKEEGIENVIKTFFNFEKIIVLPENILIKLSNKSIKNPKLLKLIEKNKNVDDFSITTSLNIGSRDIDLRPLAQLTGLQTDQYLTLFSNDLIENWIRTSGSTEIREIPKFFGYEFYVVDKQSQAFTKLKSNIRTKSLFIEYNDNYFILKKIADLIDVPLRSNTIFYESLEQIEDIVTKKMVVSALAIIHKSSSAEKLKAREFFETLDEFMQESSRKYNVQTIVLDKYPKLESTDIIAKLVEEFLDLRFNKFYDENLKKLTSFLKNVFIPHSSEKDMIKLLSIFKEFVTLNLLEITCRQEIDTEYRELLVINRIDYHEYDSFVFSIIREDIPGLYTHWKDFICDKFNVSRGYNIQVIDFILSGDKSINKRNLKKTYKSYIKKITEKLS